MRQASQPFRPWRSTARFAWSRFFHGAGRDVVMVEDLSTGVTTQLADSPFIDHAPVLSGQHIAWLRHNFRVSSPEGRGVFVASAPGESTHAGPRRPRALPLL